MKNDEHLKEDDKLLEKADELTQGESAEPKSDAQTEKKDDSTKPDNDKKDAKAKKKGLSKKSLILLIIGGVIIVVWALILVGVACGWFAGGDGDTDANDNKTSKKRYYYIAGQMVEEGGSITIEGQTPEYEADRLSENLETLQYGDYLVMYCNHENDLSYSGFVPGDVAVCRLRFKEGLKLGYNGSEANYLTGLMFNFETTNGVAIKSIDFAKFASDQYDVVVEDNYVSIKRKKEYLNTGINFSLSYFLDMRFEIPEGFDGAKISMKNIHLDTSGQNLIYEKTGETVYKPVAQYDPDSISDVEVSLLLSEDTEAYRMENFLSEDVATSRMIFYKNEGGKFVESKVEDFGECYLMISKYSKDKKTIFIINRCKDGNFEVEEDKWNTWIMYNNYGEKLFELGMVYYSADNDSDYFVGKIKESGEWKLINFDGTIVKDVNPDDFEFDFIGPVKNYKALKNISEL